MREMRTGDHLWGPEILYIIVAYVDASRKGLKHAKTGSCRCSLGVGGTLEYNALYMLGQAYGESELQTLSGR